MNRIGRTKPTIVIGGLFAAIAAATAGIFATFVPASPRPSYWFCLLDIIAIEAFQGFSYLREFEGSTGRRTRGLLPATRIAANSTSALFGLAGAAIDIAFVTGAFGASLDRFMVWLILGRWLLLATVTVPMFMSDAAHQDARPEATLLQQERLGIVETFEAGLARFRRIEPTSDSEREKLMRLNDEVQGAQNRLRALGSGGVQLDYSKIGQLVDQFTSLVEQCAASESRARDSQLTELHETTLKIRGELRGVSLARLP